MSKAITILGKENGIRIESRVLEERIQEALKSGYTNIIVEAFGQHGIGGRLWNAKKVKVEIKGQSGQRAGSLGFPNTSIEIFGPASDDLGWLNAGAEIVTYGNAGNGVANAMAQGKIYVAGNIGSRGMTMTKRNPRFEPPELWILGSAGDYFAEFMAGGIAVICGYNPQTPDNVLGYRPFVGMVGGKAFFRGKYKGFSEADAKIVAIDESNWDWLIKNLKIFLEKIKREDLFKTLSKKEDWSLLEARKSYEKISSNKKTISDFRKNVWDKELGIGGLVGDINTVDTSPIPVINTGNMRLYVPVWENEKYKSPCQASCPTGIPVQKRWSLIRKGLFDEAINLAYEFTPFPATICGYLCPNLCMQSCTKKVSPFAISMFPVDVKFLGKQSTNPTLPKFLPKIHKKVAILGGGVAGISAAWQLLQKGFDVKIFDKEKKLGGKLLSHIPYSRIPKDIVLKELERLSTIIPYEYIKNELSEKDLLKIQKENDYLIIAIGGHKPRILPVKGSEKMLTALDFLKKAKDNKIKLKEKLVIIGAGNVGCDVATEAYRLGARDITLIDVQKPLSFGEERKAAEKIGAKFKYPCFTEEITDKGILLKSGEFLEADTIIISIGDVPEISFLPKNIKTDRGFILTDKDFRTTDEKVFAIGDVVKPGLLTDAIGAGRIAAASIIKDINGAENILDKRTTIDISRVSLEYFNSRLSEYNDIYETSEECASCGLCRDCGICIQVCPQNAISRKETNNSYEYIVDEEKCIGCGFCKGACPCGIWNLIPNPTELE